MHTCAVNRGTLFHDDWDVKTATALERINYKYLPKASNDL